MFLFLGDCTEWKGESWGLHIQEHHSGILRPGAVPVDHGPVNRAQGARPQEQDRGIDCHMDEEDEQQGGKISLGISGELGEEGAVRGEG